MLSQRAGRGRPGGASPLGQPDRGIDVDRARAARYGLATGDVNATVQAAIGGQSAGDMYEEAGPQFPDRCPAGARVPRGSEAISDITVGAPGPNGAASCRSR